MENLGCSVKRAAALLLLLMAPLSAARAQGSTAEICIVGFDSEFATIQSAINAVSEGGVVLVQPGTYVENVEIVRPVTLIGTDGVTIEAADGGRAVLDVVDTEGVWIGNLALRGEASGVWIADSACTIMNCDILCGEVPANTVGVGIDIYTGVEPQTPSRSIAIIGCRVQAGDVGVSVFTSSPAAVTILGCEFVGRPAAEDETWDLDFALGGFKGIGVVTTFACDLTVAASTFDRLATGGLLVGAGIRAISDSTFRSCGTGLIATDTAEIHLIESQFVDNTLDGLSLGCLFSSARVAGSQTLIGNVICGNGRYGIHRCAVREGDPEERAVCFRGSANLISGNGAADVDPETLEFPEGFFTNECE